MPSSYPNPLIESRIILYVTTMVAIVKGKNARARMPIKLSTAILLSEYPLDGDSTVPLGTLVLSNALDQDT